jgi:predicted AAA+ superfamily ATPase
MFEHGSAPLLRYRDSRFNQIGRRRGDAPEAATYLGGLQNMRFYRIFSICGYRDVEPRLRRSAWTRPVVVLTGARQTGKTSTFRRLFPNHMFVSLNLPTEAEQAERESQSFLQRHPPPVIIDEVQYVPGLFRYLKVAVDASRNRNGQFLLTGSQKIYSDEERLRIISRPG